MKKNRALIIAAALIVSGVATATATSVTAASAAPQVPRHHSSVAPQVSLDGAYTNCSNGDFCDFAGDNGNRECLFTPITDRNWGSCINADESVANRTPGLIRLYYDTGLNGAWVCIDSSKYSNNLSAYTFDNGGTDSDGYGYPVVNDVGSSESAPGNCTNPLPLP